MSTVEQIRRLVAERNRELGLEAAVEAGLGLLFSAIVFGGVFWTAWLIFFFVFFSTQRATLIDSIVAGAFVVVSTISAWRRVNPFAGVAPLAAGEALQEHVALGLGYVTGFPVVTRRSLAGAAAVLIGGPANLFEAWATWHHRLPTGDRLLHEAAIIFEEAERGLDLRSVHDRAAGNLLHRLGLIRTEVSGRDTVTIRLTQKGEDVAPSI